MRIVYMGTPEFAVETLKALVENNYNVVGVITMPDKPAGRGHKLQYSPVKQYAMEKNLPLLQPVNLKDPEFIEELNKWNADLQIVVAFRMLPEMVWNMPSKGTINLHASLLPQYRGAAPINWAIINGDTKTGITTFLLQHEIDTGNILEQEEVLIFPEDNAGDVHDKLMTLGAQLILKTVDAIANDTVEPRKQIEIEALRPAPKIFKETCKIDWKKTPEQVHNLVRGLSPYPAAWTEIIVPNGEKMNLKIYKTSPFNEEHNLNSGTIITDGKKLLRVAVEGGYVDILELQLAGKKRMSTEELLRGFKINETFKMI